MVCLTREVRLLFLLLVLFLRYKLLIESADSKDKHNRSEEIEIWLYCTVRLGVTCPGVLK